MHISMCTEVIHMLSNWGASQVIHQHPFLTPWNFDLTSQSRQSHRRSHITWRLVSRTSAVSASREMRRTYTKSPWDWDHFALFHCLWLSMRGCSIVMWFWKLTIYSIYSVESSCSQLSHLPTTKPRLPAACETKDGRWSPTWQKPTTCIP